MKTIILSDIKGSARSVIPYGLNLAKAMNSEVIVVHVIDPRINQAKYSSFSVSNSLTPGEPFGHVDSNGKDFTLFKSELDTFLNRETSRVNYPLKVESLVKVGNLVEEIEKLIHEEPSCLLVINAVPDGIVFEAETDMYDLMHDSKVMCLLVPPGAEFN